VYMVIFLGGPRFLSINHKMMLRVMEVQLCWGGGGEMCVSSLLSLIGVSHAIWCYWNII